jgi:hypothetical protein
MFKGCTKLNLVDLRTVPNQIILGNMFNGCTNLTLGAWFNDQSFLGYNLRNAVPSGKGSGAFTGCTLLNNYSSFHSSWRT